MENSQQVQNPLPQSPLIQSVEQKPYGKKNWIKWVLIYIVLALVVYAGVYYFMQSRQNPYSANQSAVQPIVTSQPTVTPDPTANWQTYNNSKYNYTVKYPNDWKVAYTEGNVTFEGKAKVGDKPPLIAILVFESSKFKEENIPNYTPFDYKIVKKDGYTYFFVASTYQIGANASPEIEKEAKDVLNKLYSTFKFIEKATTLDSSNWKTYKDKENKYSVKYPLDWTFTVSKQVVNFNAQRPSWENLSLRIFKNKQKLSLESWVNQKIEKNYDSKHNRIVTIPILIDSTFTYQAKGIPDGPAGGLVFFTEKNNFIIQIGGGPYWSDNESEELKNSSNSPSRRIENIAGTMISTFKFF